MSKYHKDLTDKQIKLMEDLSHHEHARWASWQKYLHSKMGHITMNILNIEYEYYALHPKDFKHWERQIKTDYKDLSEAEKDSDREQVMRYWDLINK